MRLMSSDFGEMICNELVAGIGYIVKLFLVIASLDNVTSNSLEQKLVMAELNSVLELKVASIALQIHLPSSSLKVI